MAAVDLARAHCGLITTAQLTQVGLGSDGIRALAGRELTRLSSGLFVIGADPTWDQYLRAALYIAQPRESRSEPAVAYGASALHLFGLAETRLPVEVLVSRDAQPRGRDWARFIRARTPRRMLRDLDPPRTSLEDAVLDGSTSVDDADACALVTRALQERRTTPPRLAACLASRVRHRHRALIIDLINDASGVESVLEYRYVTDVERPHGLPPLQRPFVVPETGHRSDGAYVERRLLIELDGVRWHGTAADRDLDLTHDLLHYTTLRIGGNDVIRHPCATAAYVGRALGLTPSCPRCG